MSKSKKPNESVPIHNSYRVAENLYAGEYPGSRSEPETKEKIDAFRRFGVTDFFDLTETGLLRPYEPFLTPDMTYHSYPFPASGVPVNYNLMDRLIDEIEKLRMRGRKVYLHCLKGGGRAGLAVACWLGCKNKCAGEEALNRLHHLWLACPKSVRSSQSPENEKQRQFVIAYLALFAPNSENSSANAPSFDENPIRGFSPNASSPTLEQMQTYILSLQSELTQLLIERDELVYQTCRQIVARYTVTIGALECKVFEFTAETLRIQRKLELVRAKVNRRENVDLEEIDAQLDEEYLQYSEQISARRQTIDWASRYADRVFVSDDESKEIRSLYFKIVKKLHPDLCPERSKKELNLLQQAIKAFEHADLSTLKMIDISIMKIAEDAEKPTELEIMLAERDRLSDARDRLLKEINQIKNSFPYNQIEFLNDEAKVAEKEAECRRSLDYLRKQYDLLESELKKLLKEIS